ncbi:MAG: 50S ribosomal protein L22 [Candidatus Solincola sediminis]|uniref:Large ribosomal subunit protein uL22 n=1 Tax=Candidatus Solincola sediminis TaxID=1797199 RepID=A0A1F2WI08_9ACTN|nr:MAG: 50S ribosomal protein L22 [Candidatus Solincola sediminis]OFW59811.1 MAG: 50S ribosomal protein L22 [Candidatus Solincola sediminis]
MAEAFNDEGVRVQAVARYVRISPSKARQVADLIRGKGLEQARYITAFSPKEAARLIGKVLESAVANAENNEGLNADNLMVANCYVDEGPTLKRWRPRAHGRATRIRKRTSHITVVLAEREVIEATGRRGLRRRSGSKKKG